jgi:hypothetical protein
LSFTDGRIHELLVDCDWKVLYAVELSNGFGEGAMVYLARLCTKVFAGHRCGFAASMCGGALPRR